MSLTSCSLCVDALTMIVYKVYGESACATTVAAILIVDIASCCSPRNRTHAPIVSPAAERTLIVCINLIMEKTKGVAKGTKYVGADGRNSQEAQ